MILPYIAKSGNRHVIETAFVYKKKKDKKTNKWSLKRGRNEGTPVINARRLNVHAYDPEKTCSSEKLLRSKPLGLKLS